MHSLAHSERARGGLRPQTQVRPSKPLPGDGEPFPFTATSPAAEKFRAFPKAEARSLPELRRVVNRAASWPGVPLRGQQRPRPGGKCCSPAGCWRALA